MPPLTPTRPFWHKLSTIFLLWGIVTPVQAIQTPSGSVVFNRPPVLERAQLSSRTADIPNPVYRFTFKLPDNAGESLKQLEFEQVDSAEVIRFDPGRTQAYLERNGKSRQSLRVQMAYDQGRWRLTFEEPVEPGKTVTVALSAKRNPGLAGTYFMGVTAFPAGEKPQGQFLGFGRFRIQEGKRDDR